MLNVGPTASNHTIHALKQPFFESLPDTIVTVNGRQFVSNEFNAYCTTFNIKHFILTSPLFHPASNCAKF